MHDLEVSAKLFWFYRRKDLRGPSASGELDREATEERRDREVRGLGDQSVVKIRGENQLHRPRDGTGYVSGTPHRCGSTTIRSCTFELEAWGTERRPRVR